MHGGFKGCTEASGDAQRLQGVHRGFRGCTEASEMASDIFDFPYSSFLGRHKILAY